MITEEIKNAISQINNHKQAIHNIELLIANSLVSNTISRYENNGLRKETVDLNDSFTDEEFYALGGSRTFSEIMLKLSTILESDYGWSFIDEEQEGIKEWNKG